MPYYDSRTKSMQLTPREAFSADIAIWETRLEGVSTGELYRRLRNANLGVLMRAAAAKKLKAAGESVEFRACSVRHNTVVAVTYEYTDPVTGEVETIEIGGE